MIGAVDAKSLAGLNALTRKRKHDDLSWERDEGFFKRQYESPGQRFFQFPKGAVS